MITNNSIDEKQLSNILRQYGVTKASIFGSFSRGDVGPESDLDLLVTYAPGTSLFDIISLQDALEKAVSRKVDLVSQKYMSDRLAKRIKDEVHPLQLV